MIKLILIAFAVGALFEGGRYLFDEVLSETKRCQRCNGKGWWQNTRNRDKCEWCNGTGRLPKDHPL
ncbi:MAG: hypothetical protein R8P61_26110 [Bacteroidia bacterium]|nr:hypothetical protein [Bacteroidia bacterium]